MNTRLKQFLAAENITQAQFADIIKVVRASVSHVLAGRNNPSYDFIKAIMDNFPALNIEWLILGKGKMYKDKQNTEVPEAIAREQDIDSLDSGLLFSDFNDEVDTHEQNTPATSDINTSTTPIQIPVKQRNVSKIIILFDDGTFQEM